MSQWDKRGVACDNRASAEELAWIEAEKARCRADHLEEMRAFKATNVQHSSKGHRGKVYPSGPRRASY